MNIETTILNPHPSFLKRNPKPNIKKFKKEKV